MIQANELRVGNIVTDEFYQSFKTIYTVNSINKDGINLEIEDDGNWPEMASHFMVPEKKFSELMGIPITEEWLLKLGFEKTDGHDNWNFKSHEIFKYKNLFKVGKLDNRFYWYNQVDDDYYSCMHPIKYVHQLQNLFFALTGQELEHMELWTPKK